MKFTSNFALTFLSIMALINSTLAIAGIGMKFVINSFSDSSFVATFDGRGQPKSDKNVDFVVRLPGAVNTYRGMQCLAEFNMGGGADSASYRTRNVFMVGSDDSDGMVSFKGSASLRTSMFINQFMLVCNFFPTMTTMRNMVASVNVSHEGKTADISTLPVFRPFSGFVERVDISFSNTRLHPPTFTLIKPSAEIRDSSFRIQNPAAATATSATVVIFSSPISTVTKCDVEFDGRVFKSYATATFDKNHNYVDIQFKYSLNTSSKISFVCHELSAKKSEEHLPAILEAVYSGNRLNYSRVQVLYSSDVRDDVRNSTFEAALELFI